MRRGAFACEDGNVVVEFALALPVLILILAGVADLGRGVLSATSLKAAVRSGLEYAQAYPDDAAGVQAVVSRSVEGPTAVIVTANACECANGATVDCTTMCSDGTTPGTYLNIAATQPFSSFFPTTSFALGETISASASIRVK